jgi:hypothetical protein
MQPVGLKQNFDARIVIILKFAKQNLRNYYNNNKLFNNHFVNLTVANKKI